MCKLPSGGGEAARNGCSSGPAETASDRGECEQTNTLLLKTLFIVINIKLRKQNVMAKA